ncbi:MAG TPA: hypothetical protein ENH23_03555 [candidate division Zixibacteria bacterium]|nr:hypothetical protein [candidate division Zixibacteria bacterium]
MSTRHDDYYLRIEAINLDYFVYDTHDISTIRGGSFILLSIFEKLLDKFEHCLKDIGSAASIGLYEISDSSLEDAERIRTEAVAYLNEKTGHHATFAAALVRQNNGIGFEQQMQNLVAEIRLKQFQSLSFQLPQPEDTNIYCCLDHVRPGIKPDPNGKSKADKFSRSVNFRKDQGKSLRSNLYSKLLRFPDPNSFPVTSDLQELAGNSGNSLDGMMAFIYMDGNRFGKIRDAKCKTPEKLFEYQKVIQNKLRLPALKKLLQFAQLPENKSFRTKAGEIRLETLLWGGDEFEIIVPAWQAFNALNILFEVLNSPAAVFEKTSLTHAGGVVFCKHNLPILQVRNYAHALCDDIAKAGVPPEIDKITNEHNRVAFFHVSQFDLVKGNLENVIADHQFPAKADDFCYSNSGLGNLYTTLDLIKNNIPSTKIHALVTALHTGDNEIY